jgi:transposase InsO family protein
MTEEQKKQVATFRFGVIHDLVNRMDMDRGEQQRLIRDKCSRKWSIPFSTKTRIARTTILRWMRRYKCSGGALESLYPPGRSDRGKSRAMDEETVLALIGLRRELPRVTLVKLIEKMHERSLVGAGVKLYPATVYRILRRHGLMKPEGHGAQDRRKFEAELANDMWQSDVMHGPLVKVGDKMRKAYLIAFLDDHSRLITHGEFYLSEGLDCYMDALEKALSKRGLPRKLYTDNGSAMRSHHLDHVCASLGVALVHARPYKPQGKGKIERFFRHVRDGLLDGFEGGTLEKLNGELRLWLQGYHEREHGSTGQSPFKRFTANMQCLRPAPVDLADHFRKLARRKVAKDRTITLHGKLFEAPVCLIGKQVELLYHDHERDRIEIRCGQSSYGFAAAVDLHVNCTVKRDKNNNPQVTAGPSRYKSGGLWSSKKEGHAHE